MTQIYINLPEELTPGQIVVGDVVATGGPDRTIAIRCIRRASLEEYLTFVKKQGLSHMVNRSLDYMNLYLVEVLD